MKRLAKIFVGVFCTLVIGISNAQLAGSTSPDVGAGKKRAAACFSCHGADGISKLVGTPHLAGQDRAYLEAALRAYRDGLTRQNATMNAMAKPLSDRDIANISAYFGLQIRMNNGQTAEQTLETIQRIRPVGVSVIAVSSSDDSGVKASNTPVVRSGESVYKAACMACHASGAAGAPKLGDTGAWAPRIAKGRATLVEHTMKGFNAMPAKGACVSCSAQELEAAVDYLIEKSK